MRSNPESVPLAVSAVLARMPLSPGSLLLVGYSGGSDSTALLAALSREAIEHGWRVYAVHVDHNLRPEDERRAERHLVEKVSALLGTGLTFAHVAPGAISEYARSRKSGIEAAARHFRYEAFRACAKRLDAKAIFLGHTMDDQLETVIMRAAGGAGAGGLKGIPPEAGLLRRPLLSCTKSDILAYLGTLSLPYSSDSTNDSDLYSRNKVRHSLLPALDRSLPGWRSGLSLTAQKSGLDEEAFGFFAASSPGNFAEVDAKTQSADAIAFSHEPLALRIRMLLAAAGSLSGRSRLSWRMASEAVQAIETEGKTFRGGGFALYSKQGRLFLRYGLDFPRCGGYFVEVEAPGLYRAGKLRVRFSWEPEMSSRGIRAGTFTFPLVIRSRLPGDHIASAGGTKKLDDLFIEWKVPPGLRDEIPVMEDSAGIVAILGRNVGVKDRFRPAIEGLAHADGSGMVLSIVMKGVRVSDGF